MSDTMGALSKAGVDAVDGCAAVEQRPGAVIVHTSNLERQIGHRLLPSDFVVALAVAGASLRLFASEPALQIHRIPLNVRIFGVAVPNRRDWCAYSPAR